MQKLQKYIKAVLIYCYNYTNLEVMQLLEKRKREERISLKFLQTKGLNNTFFKK